MTDTAALTDKLESWAAALEPTARAGWDYAVQHTWINGLWGVIGGIVFAATAVVVFRLYLAGNKKADHATGWFFFCLVLVLAFALFGHGVVDILAPEGATLKELLR